MNKKVIVVLRGLVEAELERKFETGSLYSESELEAAMLQLNQLEREIEGQSK